MQAVILAAGKGLRLRPYTQHHPKPTVPIQGKPLIVHTLNSLPKKVSEVIIVVGYLGEQIKNLIGNSFNKIIVSYVEQTELIGTGDAIFRAKNFLGKEFLVVNGDDLYNQSNLEDLAQTKLGILTWDSGIPNGSRYGIKVDQNGNFTGFNADSTLINCGAYKLDETFFNFELEKIPVRDSHEFSLPHTLAKIAQTQKVSAVAASFWMPIGTPHQLEQANQIKLV